MMYQSEQMLEALMELILTTEFEEEDIRAMYERLQPHIAPFIEALGIAKISIHIEFAPNVYDLSGRGETLETAYHDDAGGEPLTFTYADLYMTTGTVNIHPRASRAWSEEEKRCIAAVAKLVAMQFSRANMVHRIERLSYIDLLTGLANSQGVTYYGARIEQSGSLGEYAGCFVNLKNFKYIHQQLLSGNSGDAVIRQYALRLYGFMDHRSELVARLGGDNFFVLIRKERLERFLKFISSLIIILSDNGKRTRLTIDSWVGVYPANGDETVGDMLTNASYANEQAKKSHISVAYYEPSIKERILHAKKIAHTLPDAMRAQELIAYYQPRVSASSGELCGGEALVRWMRGGEVIPPSDFVPAAEMSGMITSLDLYMLETVCRDIRGWIDNGVEPVRVSVNYSQVDFYRETLIDDTLEIVRKYCVDGSYLEIEITESSFHENFSALQAFIDAMHKVGIKVTLDDFGTGYSSLNMLKSLDLDTVKLDKSFFDNLSEKGEKDRVMLQSIAEMIGKMDKTAVSEGLENAEQIDFARRIGCDIVQGFYFDKPLSREEFTERLKSRRYDVR